MLILFSSKLSNIVTNLLNCFSRQYFSEHGIEYNLARLPIGGTDFSLRAYTYDDGDPDPLLENFKLAHEDTKYKVTNHLKHICKFAGLG